MIAVASLLAALAIGAYLLFVSRSPQGTIPGAGLEPLLQSNMKITSSAFAEGGRIPDSFTCDGSNQNPPLAFEEVPEQAVSLVLTVDDPDAPQGVFDHWVVFNIPPKTAGVMEGEPLVGTYGMNGAGKPGYIGPCPPQGVDHRYFFKLYAIDMDLALPRGTTKDKVLKAIAGHVLAEASLTGLYARVPHLGQ